MGRLKNIKGRDLKSKARRFGLKVENKSGGAHWKFYNPNNPEQYYLVTIHDDGREIDSAYIRRFLQIFGISEIEFLKK